MKTKPKHRKSTLAGAFTLVELLVVIVIIIVLAAIVFTVTQSIRRSATKVADMSNLKNLATAAMAAASDNAGKLPAIHAKTDTTSSTPQAQNPAPYYLVGRRTLESNGIFKEACYIPRKGVLGGAPDYAWWTMFKEDDQTPVHYCYYANDSLPNQTPWFQQGTVEKPSRSEYRGAIPYDTIIQDKTKAFPRNFTDDAWYPVLWSGIVREYKGDTLAALMDNKNKALGVNIMYLDGHAEWKDAKQSKLRYTGSTGVKVFW